ncbi:MAG: alkaline phosphatase family protein, partial [Myxococcales bacterium]|nr:alkaline phosphatase family protein [Myxococcales bacterium]
PRLDAWLAEGVVTLSGTTHLTGVTSSGPGWATLLFGVEVEDHGVVSNDTLGAGRDRGLQTFVGKAHAAGRSAAALFHWVGIGGLIPQEEADLRTATADDLSVGRLAAEVVAGGTAELVFLHHDDVDHAGHATGFSPTNPDYLAAIEQVDVSVGLVHDAILARGDAEAWMMVLVTDHGGEGTSHGLPDAANRTIPLGVVAPRVAQDEADLLGASQLDVAPTILTWLGVEIGETAGSSWIDLD